MADDASNAPRPSTSSSTPLRPKRSPAKWLLLLIVWVIGLAAWAVYIATLIMAAVYLTG